MLIYSHVGYGCEQSSLGSPLSPAKDNTYRIPPFMQVTILLSKGNPK